MIQAYSKQIHMCSKHFPAWISNSRGNESSNQTKGGNRSSEILHDASHQTAITTSLASTTCQLVTVRHPTTCLQASGPSTCLNSCSNFQPTALPPPKTELSHTATTSWLDFKAPTDTTHRQAESYQPEAMESWREEVSWTYQVFGKMRLPHDNWKFFKGWAEDAVNDEKINIYS